jgi:hypothetical protein
MVEPISAISPGMSTIAFGLLFIFLDGDSYSDFPLALSVLTSVVNTQ